MRAARTAFRLLAPHAPDLAARAAERLFLTAPRHRRPAWEAEALASAGRLRIPHGSSFLPAWEWVPPAAGADRAPTVVLVHGWEGRGSQLAPFVDPLLARGLRVLAFDAPGHGDAPTRLASVVEHARAIVSVSELVRGRGGKVHGVIGHSVGGAASVLATRFGLEAARFALIAPPISPERFAEGFAKVLELPPAVSAGMIARVERRYGVRMNELDVRGYAANLDALLVVHDAGDKVVPHADGASIAAAARHGQLVTTEGLGHHRILRAPAVVDAIVPFVAADASPAERVSFAETLDGELYYRGARW